MSGQHDRLRVWRNHGVTTRLRKDARPDSRRSNRRITRVVKVCVIECIEHFCPELKLEPLGKLEGFDKTIINIPVTRRHTAVSSGALSSWYRQAENLVWICPAGKGIPGCGAYTHRREQHRSGECL